MYMVCSLHLTLIFVFSFFLYRRENRSIKNCFSRRSGSVHRVIHDFDNFYFKMLFKWKSGSMTRKVEATCTIVLGHLFFFSSWHTGRFVKNFSAWNRWSRCVTSGPCTTSMVNKYAKFYLKRKRKRHEMARLYFVLFLFRLRGDFYFRTTETDLPILHPFTYFIKIRVVVIYVSSH